jgi:hypothetical protein
MVEVSRSRGEWVDPGLARMPVGVWARSWRETQVQLKPSTAERYRVALDRQILPTWEKVPLAAVSYTDVSTWVAELVAWGLAVDRAVRLPGVLPHVGRCSASGPVPSEPGGRGAIAPAGAEGAGVPRPRPGCGARRGVRAARSAGAVPRLHRAAMGRGHCAAGRSGAPRPAQGHGGGRLRVNARRARRDDTEVAPSSGGPDAPVPGGPARGAHRREGPEGAGVHHRLGGTAAHLQLPAALLAGCGEGSWARRATGARPAPHGGQPRRQLGRQPRRWCSRCWAMRRQR